MSLFSSPTAYTLGIDVSDHIIRAARIRHHGSRYDVIAASEAALPEGMIVNGVITQPQELLQLLRATLLPHVHAKHSTSVIGLPESHGYIKTVLAQPEHLNEEVQRHLPFPENEVIIDTIDYGSIEPGSSIHAIGFAAIKTTIAQSYLEIFSALGLHVRALEIESQAIARLTVPSSSDHSITIIGDIGRNHTTFVVVQDDHIDFTHTSALVSGKALTQTLQQQLGLSPEDAEQQKIHNADHPQIKPLIEQHTILLANELKRVVGFHHEHTFGATDAPYLVKLIGGGSQIPNVQQYLEDAIRFPVQYTTLPQHIHVQRHVHLTPSSYATAIGLAMRNYHPL